MKNLTTVVAEASRNEKKRNLRFFQEFLVNGKNLGNIGSFVIFTAENPSSQRQDKRINRKNMDDLKKQLKNLHYVSLNINGFCDGNMEHSLIVFNMNLEEAEEWNLKCDQTSFFFVHPDSDGKSNFIADYYEKEDAKKRADRVTNPYKNKGSYKLQKEGPNDRGEYSILGNGYKFTFESTTFESVNNVIQKGLEYVCEMKGCDKETALEWIYNRVGYGSYSFKKLFTDKIIESNSDIL